MKKFGSESSCLKSSITNFRVTRGKARYFHSWWQRWLMPWRWLRFWRKPTVPFSSDPYMTNVRKLMQFDSEPFATDAPPPAFQVVQAVKNSVAAGLKPGWHTATITFKLDDKGNLLYLDEYKVSSFGEDHP